ncbi:transposase, partial [Mycobacterium pyrenivorans]
GDSGGPKVLVRCDTAGATHGFADACREQGVGFSFGYPVDWRVQDAVDTLNLGQCWYPAIDTGGGIRDGAWVAEATDLVNLSSWPPGTRLILRKERPVRREALLIRTEVKDR